MGVAFTRTLVAEPANIIYPESFVERCQDMRAMGVEIQVLDEDAMRALGMGALLGVSQGSAQPARLLALRWDGTGGAQAQPVALVGKGVTFDTGGISIKPAAGMEDMKWDMGGAGAVAGAIRALAGRKAKVHVVGVCGLVENMPSGTAQRPGDVVTTMSRADGRGHQHRRRGAARAMRRAHLGAAHLQARDHRRSGDAHRCDDHQPRP